MELARLAERVRAIGLPEDLDDLSDAIFELRGEGRDLPAFVSTYREMRKAAERRRLRRRPRFAPESPREAARLIGRLMGHVEAAMEDYLTETYELCSHDARPAHIAAGARLAQAAAQMGATIASLAGEARRFHFQYEKLARARAEEGE